jgi:hypothetical protein
MKLTANPFMGRWKIVWMEVWDQDFVDEEVPGHVTLGDEGRGDFQFGYVCGNDEMDPAHGDIHCEIKEGELYGIIGLFNGDRSAFRAVWENKPVSI